MARECTKVTNYVSVPGYVGTRNQLPAKPTAVLKALELIRSLGLHIDADWANPGRVWLSLRFGTDIWVELHYRDHVTTRRLSQNVLGNVYRGGRHNLDDFLSDMRDDMQREIDEWFSQREAMP